MSQLDFNEDLSKQMEVAYRRRDMRRRRELVHETFAAAPGERILDAGCGPGFYTSELLDRVGPEGSVVAVDASPAMLALAAERCAGQPNVSFHEGDVTALPVDSEAFDRALSVQVLEYVDDIPAALGELRRAVRPGGRVLVWDIDWGTLSWHSDDPARMERVMRAWDDHLNDPYLPRRLAAALRAAGFEDVEMEGHTFATTEVTEETYAGALAGLMGDYVSERIGAEEAAAWADEQRDLLERGESYFACIQFCFTGTRPA